MNIRKYLRNSSYLITAVLIMSACTKAFVEKKPYSDLIVPSTLDDCQGLLDNQLMSTGCPALGQLGSDEYYQDYSTWQSLSLVEGSSYVWASDIYRGNPQIPDWNAAFNAIYTSNVVLSVLNEIDSSKSLSAYREIKGQALFFRAFRYWGLIDVFTMPYSKTNASQAVGLPLRSSPDIDKIYQRATLQQTYEMVVDDLVNAASYMSGTAPDNIARTRPCKVAAYALLARVYLNMQLYDKALEASNKCLQIYSKLYDYNLLSTTVVNPISNLNDEILFKATQNTYPSIQAQNVSSFVDSNIIKLYDVNDLRKQVHFTFNSKGQAIRKNMYSDSYKQCNAGIMMDEVYLIRAECYARTGDIINALKDLNNLLRTRWKKNANGTTTYIDKVGLNQVDALSKILEERRKELLFSGLRWNDVRRLNVENYGITMTRNLNGSIYTLPPNDNRFAFPIPDGEINYSGISQNPR